MDVIFLVGDEAGRAHAKYGSFTSTHEGLGVLAEEYAELVEAIRSNDGAAIFREAVQVAAVAARIAEALAMAELSFITRSNLK